VGGEVNGYLCSKRVEVQSFGLADHGDNRGARARIHQHYERRDTESSRCIPEGNINE
jgi:hypothetical protein